MTATLQIEFKFVTASTNRASLEVNSESDVLQCDKASWFRHIEASAVVSVAAVALIVSGDNSLSIR
jgi:hypothetical protein